MRFLRLFLMSILLLLAHPVRAAGVVTDCSTYGPGVGTLQAALAGGGTITFSCSGTIIVPGIEILTDTTLDGSGQNIILSGNNANGVLYVNAPVSVTLKNLTIANGRSFNGGGIANTEGDVTLDHVTVRNNRATHDSGSNGGGISGYYGSLTIIDSTISNNQATHFGGGIFNHYGTLTITNSTISENSAEGGAGIHNYDGMMTVANSIISDNTLVGDSPFGGGIANYSFPAAITGSTISGNSGGDWAVGGGISGYNLTIRDSVISGNTVGNGAGGIYAFGLTLTNSQVTNNHSDGSYGGIVVGGDGASVIDRSLIAGNSAQYNVGGISISGNLTIANTTITDNHADQQIGAIEVMQGANIVNSTIVGNSAPEAAGIHVYSANSVRNTIIADNGSGANCYLFDEDAILNSTHNLSDDVSCPGFTQTTLANLNLGALTGTPAYFPLLTGSVAIDVGSIDFCPDTDQRGVVRPQGSGCDIGAYEYEQDAPDAVPDRNFFDTTTPTLTWNRVSWAAGYTVEVDDDADFSSLEFRGETLGSDALSVQTDELTRGRYYWRVCAHVDANRCGKWSQVERFWVEG